MSTSTDVAAVVAALKKKKKDKLPSRELLSWGSSLLNLACTNKVAGGIKSGCYYFLVGDSASGKTFLSLTCFAEAIQHPKFKDYRLIHDNAENGALMDFETFFGLEVAKKAEPPSTDNQGESVYSMTVEHFYDNLDDAFNRGEPFIYVLDSQDVLTADADVKKIEQQKKARRRNADNDGDGAVVAGSYGTSKAKVHSERLRHVVAKLKQSGSILIIINQTRDNIGGGPFSEKKTRSGGHALKFYATIEVWTSIKQTLKKKVNEKDRVIGHVINVKVKKNRTSGRNRTVSFPIYHSYGIDDVGGMVDYLLEEKHWKKTPVGIKAEELGLTVKREALIKHVEDNDLQNALKDVVQKVWASIEDQCSLRRKPRYQ